MINLWKKIEEKQFAPLYLLYGTEGFLINETKQKLMNNVLTEEEKDFNFATYDLEETPVETAIEEAETLPFMGERRLVILHNPIFLTGEKKKDKVEHNLARLEAYLSNPSPFTILVFAAPYEKLDERKKLTKLLKKQAIVAEAKKLNEGELKVWVRDRAAENGVQIDEEAIDLLLALSGANLMMLMNELDKLALYCQDSKRIDQEAVSALASRSLEQNIFDLVDKAVKRNIDQALRIYYDLLKQNEEPIKILAVLAGQFRLIFQVKELGRRGYGPPQIAGRLKVHPFRVKLALGQAEKFTEEEIVRIMDRLARADLQMKTSAMDKKVIIELFLLKLSKGIAQ